MFLCLSAICTCWTPFLGRVYHKKRSFHSYKSFDAKLAKYFAEASQNMQIFAIAPALQKRHLITINCKFCSNLCSSD